MVEVHPEAPTLRQLSIDSDAPSLYLGYGGCNSYNWLHGPVARIDEAPGFEPG
jgi:hypothetical protein